MSVGHRHPPRPLVVFIRNCLTRKSCLGSCRYTPDVVFLQELIPPYVQYLKKRAVSYLIIEGEMNVLSLFDQGGAAAVVVVVVFISHS